MAVQADSNMLKSSKNRCRICLEATNAKIELNQTIHYKETGILLRELLEFCVNEQVYENGKADGVCFDCMEKGTVYYGFKRLFKISQDVLLKEMEGNNGFSFEIKVEEDFEGESFAVESENIVIKHEILEQEEMEQVKQNSNECKMALQTDCNMLGNAKSRCRICLEATNGKIELNQTILYKETGILLRELLEFCVNEQVYENGKADGLCLDCLEKGMVCNEFKRRFKVSQAVLLKEIFSYAIKAEEDFPEGSFEVKSENIVIKDEILEEEEKEEQKEGVEHQRKLCEKTFKLRSSLVRQEHTQKPRNHCSYVQESSAALVQGMRNAIQQQILKNPDPLLQPVETKKPTRPPKAKNKKYTCEYCGKSMSDASNLVTHRRIHTGEKPFSCEECGMNFNRSGHLAYHRRIHTGEKPYSCKECVKSYTNPSALKKHQVVHAKQKDHVCQNCGATFATVRNLRRHEVLHTAEALPYKCTICKKAFRTNWAKKRHMVTHTQVRNYACDICEKRFIRNSALKVHRMIHTGETPHICKVCGKGFIQSQNLGKHMTTHHLSK